MFRKRMGPTAKPSGLFFVYVALITGLGIFLRLPPLFSERGDYLFCDESIFLAEVHGMLAEGRMLPAEFRSGPLNSWLVFFPALLVEGIAGTELSSDHLLTLGRLILPIILGGLAVVPTAIFSKELFRSERVGLFAAVLMATTPGFVAVSRIWYPDHFIAFFSAMTGVFLVRLLNRQTKLLDGFLLGVFLALALAVKLTAVFLLIPVFLILAAKLLGPLISSTFNMRNFSGISRPAFLSILVLSGFFVSFLLVNLNAWLNWSDFTAAQEFNSTNYGGFASNPFSGMAAYFLIATVISPGLIGTIGLAAATVMVAIDRTYRTRVFLLWAAVLGAVVVLGSQELFVNRNLAPYFPLVASISAFGLHRLTKIPKNSLLHVASTLLMLLGFVLHTVSLGALFRSDLTTDSRLIAEEWLVENISQSAVVGTNTGCAGSSPAEEAGFEVVRDPFLQETVDYWVFTSYWESAISSNFRGRGAAPALVNQRYLHFYMFGDKRVLSPLLGLIHPLPPQIPEGFTVLNQIESNGPDVWILEKAPPA